MTRAASHSTESWPSWTDSSGNEKTCWRTEGPAARREQSNVELPFRQGVFHRPGQHLRPIGDFLRKRHVGTTEFLRIEPGREVLILFSRRQIRWTIVNSYFTIIENCKIQLAIPY